MSPRHPTDPTRQDDAAEGDSAHNSSNVSDPRRLAISYTTTNCRVPGTQCRNQPLRIPNGGYEFEYAGAVELIVQGPPDPVHPMVVHYTLNGADPNKTSPSLEGGGVVHGNVLTVANSRLGCEGGTEIAMAGPWFKA